MALNYLTSIDLNQNELLNPRIQNLASDPSTPVAGQVYFNTGTGLLRVYAGSQWLNLAASSSTGTIDTVNGGAGISTSQVGNIVTVSHTDTSSVSDSTNTNNTVLQSITFDTFGHVQTISTKALTLTGLGFTGATNADNYNGFGIIGTSGSIANVASGASVTLLGDGTSSIVSGNEITISNTDKGTAQFIFKNIAADSGTNAVADNNDDTLTIAGGQGISTSANSTTDTVTVSVDSTVVRTSGDQTIAGVKTFSDNVVIEGNFTVVGEVTTTLSQTVEVEDSLFLLSKNQTGAPTLDSGFIIERGTSLNSGLIWDESQDEFAVISTSDVGTTAGNVVISDYVDFKAKTLLSEKILLSNTVNGVADYDRFLVLDGTEVKYRSGAQVRSDIGAGTVNSVTIAGTSPISVANGTITNTGTATISVADASLTAKGVVELATSAETLALTDAVRAVTPSGLSGLRYKQNIGNGSATSFTVTHSLGTRDVAVELYDNATYETVYADVVRTSTSQVTVSFNTAPSTNAYRVLIYKV